MELSGDFRVALRDFLTGQYDTVSLERVVAELPRSDVIRAHLTYPTSRFLMSREVVALCLKHGQLDELKKVLLQQRTQLVDLVEKIWSLPMPVAMPSSGASSLPRPQPSIPLPPQHLEERPEYVAIRAALRSKQWLTGITGLPGSGKTTAAIASLDRKTRSAFEAVCWLASDENAPLRSEDVRKRLARQLAGKSPNEISREELAGLAQEVVGDGDLLIVLDELRGRLDHLVEAARCHPRARVLVTATDSSAFLSIGLRDPFQLAGLPEEAGLRLMAWWADMDVATLPPAARNLAQAIGFHAEGLRILATNVGGALNKNAEWSYLEEQLGKRGISARALPGIPEANLAVLVDHVVDGLSPELRELIQVLAVPPAGTLLDLHLLAALSGVAEEECRRMGDDLLRRSIAATTSGRYGLRALVHLRTRELQGFDTTYRTTVERLQPERPPIVWSIVMGDVPMALRFVEQSTAYPLTESTPEMGSPLHQAAFHGLAEVVAAIIARGGDPRSLDRTGADALHYAAQAGQTAVGRQLMAHGLSPLRPNDSGKDALFVALYHRHLSMAQALVEAEVSPARETNLALDLQFAVKRGALPVVERLAALGAPLDPDLGQENSPILALAVSRNHVEIARFLLTRGGEHYRRATLSEALLLAAQNNHIELLQPLLEADADLNWRNKDGRTPLHQAAVMGHSEVLGPLLRAGASPVETDAKGWTPLHMASGFHHPDVVTVLSQAGVDLDPQGAGGERPLGLSILNAGPGVSMKSSAKTDHKGTSWSSVVVLTDIDPDASETVSRLLTAGADVNATNSAGRSALHHAAAVLQPALVELLLAHGARRDLRDTAGKTPLDIARESAGRGDAPLMFLRPDALIKLLEG